MPKIIEAIYEDGVFKPLEKVELKEGEKIKLRIDESISDIIKKYRKKFKLNEEDIEVFLANRR
ncbi:antitoxin family protein [Archaeoglobus neptunius]|uniref:antitoxin family protein n=1 Tax=Archaeoglobus neptunius TaxID=2798580 RepID=UPI0019274925|nr:antitoxin family protein [Archaeoglobus neptunius]